MEKGSVPALHGARVASRRLREVLPVLQIDAEAASSLGRRLRKVTRRLGSVREVDVLRQLIDDLRRSHRYDERALSRVSTGLESEQFSRRERLLAKAPLADLRRVAAKIAKVEAHLVGRDAGRASTRSWRWAIDARVGHRASALKAAVAAAGSVYLPGRVHAVRIALKKFRYAAEVEHEIAADRMRSQDLALLQRLQEVLGHLQDRQVLVEHVREVQASPSTPADAATERGLDALVTAIETDCRRLHARYVRDAAALSAVCDRVIESAQAAPARRRA